jgi:hypothetical protein
MRVLPAVFVITCLCIPVSGVGFQVSVSKIMPVAAPALFLDCPPET